jgi:hypothetical protein
MRALVLVSNDATEWFESLQPQRLRMSVAAVKDKIILFSNTKSKRDLLSSISDIDDISRDILTSLIIQTPRGVLENVEIDCSVGISNEEVQTFETVLAKVQEVCGLRDRGGTTGESSSELFRRTILPLAHAASKVEIFDKYGAALLLNNHGAALKALLEVDNLEVIMHTGPSANDVESIQGYENRIQEIQKLWEGLLNRTRSSVSNKSLSRLNIYQIEGRQFHNRWIVFHYLEDSKLLMGLPKGLQEFASEKIREVTSFALNEDPSNITTVRSDWINFRKDLKRHTGSWIGNTRI